MSGSPLAQILVAIGMMVSSIALSFVMVMRIIEPTLGLCFATFTLTFVGFILGIIGITQYVRPRRRDGD